MKAAFQGIHSIRFKIAVLVTALLVFTAFFFSLLTVQTMNAHIEQSVMKKAESLGRSVAAISAYSILSGDILGIDNVVSKIKNTNPDVEYAAVTDVNNRILAHDRLEKRGGQLPPPKAAAVKAHMDGGTLAAATRAHGEVFELRTPIVFRSRILGTVVIGFNNSALLAARKESMGKILAGLGATLVLALGAAFVLSSFVTKPIRELSKGVHRFREGARSVPLTVYSRDELGILTNDFNTMTELIGSQQQRLERYAGELEEAYVSTVKVLAAAIDARDPFTLGHSARVAKLSVRIGESIGMSEKELEDLEVAALFHDLGKLRTPDYVLLKKGVLDSSDFLEMKKHPEHGAEILARAASLKKYVPAVKHHHEWFNGNGYPDRLSGRDIPLQALIISIADAYDAMTSERPYKSPLSPEVALMEIKLFAGSQFDPDLVAVFVRVLGDGASDASGAPGYIRHEHS